MSIMFAQLIYVSASRQDLEPGDFGRILASARRNNAANGITGMLLNVDQGFLQYLEGEHQVVEETFARIQTDRRHLNPRVIYRGETPRRCFESWNMGFEDLRGLDITTPNAFPVSRAALMDQLPASLGADILILIRTFYDVNAKTLKRTG